MPGFIEKTYLWGQETQTTGGVYKFRDKASIDAYLASDFWSEIYSTPEFADMTVRTFAVLEDATRLTHALGPDGPVVTHVHGIGGIGKSRLLEVFGSMARAKGRDVVQLDFHSIEPSPIGFVRALSAAIGVWRKHVTKSSPISTPAFQT